MQLPVQITTRDIPVSGVLASHIRKKAEKLNQYYPRINSCRIVIDLPQKHKRQGKLYSVKISLTVPGKELVVNHKNNEDIYIALREAFIAMARQLEEHARKRQGRVKTHNDCVHGHVTKMVPDEGFGFIQGTDGNEYYFSMTNVGYPSFSQLMVGDAVAFIAQSFSDGRHAHHVLRERNHSIAA